MMNLAIRGIDANLGSEHGKYGYPPDKQERATLTVLQQAELLAPE